MRSVSVPGGKWERVSVACVSGVEPGTLGCGTLLVGGAERVDDDDDDAGWSGRFLIWVLQNMVPTMDCTVDTEPDRMMNLRQHRSIHLAEDIRRLPVRFRLAGRYIQRQPHPCHYSTVARTCHVALYFQPTVHLSAPH